MKYITRDLVIFKNHSAFLFGARNTGKSTLLKEIFSDEQVFWINLLDTLEEERYSRDPSLLLYEVRALPSEITHVVIDEIQKIPRLLDVVHNLIETTKKIFILTGSSARKLRHGGANLLAGRAFIYHLFPFTTFELGSQFDLATALHWGTLPTIFQLKSDSERLMFLQAYTQTYLKEEIWLEQFIRKLEPFRKFLEVSAQCNGKIINLANIAADVGVDDKTIKQYFSILEDTLLGFLLEPFVHSFRKRLSMKPKFYYFDTGVVRALSRQLSVELTHSTSAYGDAFEHFIILECVRLASYHFPEFRFSYLKTKDDAEIDLVVERPGKSILFIEIKSSTNVRPQQLDTLKQLSNSLGNCEAVCFSQDPRAKQFDEIRVLPWKQGIKEFFTES